MSYQNNNSLFYTGCYLNARTNFNDMVFGEKCQNRHLKKN
jgi:hypothetical protein